MPALSQKKKKKQTDVWCRISYITAISVRNLPRPDRRTDLVPQSRKPVRGFLNSRDRFEVIAAPGYPISRGTNVGGSYEAIYRRTCSSLIASNGVPFSKLPVKINRLYIFREISPDASVFSIKSVIAWCEEISLFEICPVLARQMSQ
ncbi:hypothetical protein K0M31_016819 [Melipona bicolor]|uniref:Uncharacterized protein n=1 Tax=Melipona bicolor TaxID=60889 RepID=A0AA40FDZ8_9HYME|nr:hypothetical protein K0M31_016819 [Melipona bicolor]